MGEVFVSFQHSDWSSLLFTPHLPKLETALFYMDGFFNVHNRADKKVALNISSNITLATTYFGDLKTFFQSKFSLPSRGQKLQILVGMNRCPLDALCNCLAFSPLHERLRCAALARRWHEVMREIERSIPKWVFRCWKLFFV